MITITAIIPIMAIKVIGTMDMEIIMNMELMNMELMNIAITLISTT